MTREELMVELIKAQQEIIRLKTEVENLKKPLVMPLKDMTYDYNMKAMVEKK